MHRNSSIWFFFRFRYISQCNFSHFWCHLIFRQLIFSVVWLYLVYFCSLSLLCEEKKCTEIRQFEWDFSISIYFYCNFSLIVMSFDTLTTIFSVGIFFFFIVLCESKICTELSTMWFIFDFYIFFIKIFISFDVYWNLDNDLFR